MPATMSAMMAADEALELIQAGEAPEGLTVEGTLKLEKSDVASLPSGLTVRRLVLDGCRNLESLPDDLHVRHLEVRGCPKLTTLPERLSCCEIVARESHFENLPDDLTVDFRLDLASSQRLKTLGKNLKAGSLILRGCTALEALPTGLEVCFLDLQGCRQLTTWPRDMTIGCGNVNLTDCTGFTRLPAALTEVAQLNLRGCTGIKELPPKLVIRSWLDVAGSGITKLPRSLKDVPLRWRGVAVTERIVFHPETLTADEVLNEANAEVRRVMLERMGFERFLEQAKAEVRDRDTDAGGERRLVHVPIPGDEALVCLSVFCPSTGRQYVLRVPPGMRTCRQAAAWIAGFSDPDEYDPAIET